MASAQDFIDEAGRSNSKNESLNAEELVGHRQNKVQKSKGLFDAPKIKTGNRRFFRAERSFARGVQSFNKRVAGFAPKIIEARRRPMLYSRDVIRPLVGQGRGKKPGGGRGRPKGTYKYYIPGVGPASVYDWRKYNSTRRAIYKAQALAQIQQQSLSPQQRNVLARFQEQQNANKVDIEKQTIPDTTGVVRLRTINDEISEAANLVP